MTGHDDPSEANKLGEGVTYRPQGPAKSGELPSAAPASADAGAAPESLEAIDVLQQAISNLLDRHKQPRAAGVKSEMQQIISGKFDQSAYGYQTFRDFLDEAAAKGAVVVVDSTNRGDALVTLPGRDIPRISLPADAILAGAAPPRLVPAGSAALQLLTGYLRSALSGSVLSAAPIAARVVSHVTELISLSLNPTSGPPGPAAVGSVRAARLAAIKADIARNLTDGALSAPALAARHGISTRYLHKLFDDEEVTFSQFVLDQRLALACKLLRSPRSAARTISSIAYGAGFGDLSYFNRTFRRRYGTTPSDLRRG